jgi:hypothetical protein
MGKVAKPNTPYCGEFTQGAISAGGAIFVTQNPPISYTLDGATATISDATGVIGTADLTGNLVEESKTKITSSSGCGCDGFPKVEINGFVSNNPPICWATKTKGLLINGNPWTAPKEIQSWSTQQQSEPELQVTWPTGEVDVIAGTTWTTTSFLKGGWFEYSRSRAHWLSGAAKCTYYSVIRALRTTRLPVIITFSNTSTTEWLPYPSIDWSQLTTTQSQDRDPGATWTYDEGDPDTRCPGELRRPFCYRNGVRVGALDTNLEAFAYFETREGAYQVTSNTGASIRRESEVAPTVKVLGQGCNLNITYTDGEIQTLNYPDCPTVEPLQCLEVSDQGGVLTDICPSDTEAFLTCYDYDIREVTYSCEGNCPSAEFECRCETSNTLMCYGWDPNDPDVFKPLFTTSITSG